MRISLIATPLMDFSNGQLSPISMDAVRTCPPYGIYLLATILRQHGHEVIIIDLIAQGTKELSHHAGLIMSSHLIGIGASSLSWPTAKRCIEDIRSWHPYVPIILGGIHATMFDRYVLSTTSANFCIRGEGEIAFPFLCEVIEKGLDPGQVQNLTYKLPDGSILRNKPGPLISDTELTGMPMPDYSCLHSNVYTGLAIESSRGCPFDCVFCSTSYRKTWRGIPAKKFVDRIENLLPFIDKTTHKIIQIIDDEFCVKNDRAKTVFKELKNRGIKAKIVFDARANDLLDESLLKAAQPYAHQFLVGTECGYDEGLKKIGKGTTIKKLAQAASLLNKHGIAERADFSFIIGLPWETKDQVMQTIDFAVKLYRTYDVRVLLQWYCQIPGSRLWDDQRQHEILHEAIYDDFGFFRNHYLFRSGISLTPSEIHEVTRYINQLQQLSRRNINGMEMIQSSIPEPILKLYPNEIEDHKISGLSNLREVAGIS